MLLGVDDGLKSSGLVRELQLNHASLNLVVILDFVEVDQHFLGNWLELAFLLRTIRLQKSPLLPGQSGTHRRCLAIGP
jgi:hypothetical protein